MTAEITGADEPVAEETWPEPPLVLPEPLPERGERIATVRAVRIGRVRPQVRGRREFETGAIKDPRSGPVRLTATGFEGDEQADLKNHGGVNKAALLYAGHRYSQWRAEEGLDLPEGGLFENITLEPGSPDESSVRMGEVWRLGTAVVQVTQPRSPCWKLASIWGIEDLAVRVQTRGWTGWYVRVLAEGEVGPADPVERLAVPEGAWPVGEVGRVVNVDKKDERGARALLGSPGVPARWRDKLIKRLGGAGEDDTARLGPGR